MSSEISSRAEVSPRARIGNGCKIYPFAYIEEDVVIGDNCVIYPFVSIMNGSRIGNGNTIYQGSVIGALPQDYDFLGERSECVLGDNNIVRENVVINRATHEGCQTVLGSNNFLMEGAHISHDTKVGDGCVFGYGVKIAGDCEIGNRVFYSPNVFQKANTRVGTAATIQAGTTFGRDVPPYIIAGGTPVAYHGVNASLCSAIGFEPKIIKHIANAYRLLFHGQTSVIDAHAQIKQQVKESDAINEILRFIETTNRGIITKL